MQAVGAEGGDLYDAQQASAAEEEAEVERQVTAGERRLMLWITSRLTASPAGRKSQFGEGICVRPPSFTWASPRTE